MAGRWPVTGLFTGLVRSGVVGWAVTAGGGAVDR